MGKINNVIPFGIVYVSRARVRVCVCVFILEVMDLLLYANCLYSFAVVEVPAQSFRFLVVPQEYSPNLLILSAHAVMSRLVY